MNYYASIIFIFFIISCQSSSKKRSSSQPVNSETRSNLKERTLKTKSLTFTAYKTTNKIGVPGTFKEIHTTNDIHKVSASPSEALNGIEFEIPISSLSTNNPIRDSTILASFFKNIQNSKISGSFKGFKGETGTGIIMLNFNGLIQELPVQFSSEQKAVRFSSILNLGNWNALNALASINKSCFDLHKGPDRVSKTWKEIKIDGQVAFKE